MDIGDGKRINFWNDLWTGRQLKEEFFCCIAVCSVKEGMPCCSIQKLNGDSMSWDLHHRRNIRDVELEEIEGVVDRLNLASLSPNRELSEDGGHLRMGLST